VSERGTPARSLEFLNRIGIIDRLAEKQPEEANGLLDVLMGELKQAEDGVGGWILSAERYMEFIACDLPPKSPQFDG